MVNNVKSKIRLLCLFFLLLVATNRINGIMSSQGFLSFKNYYFVETGTHVGNGVALALKTGFREIHSLETDKSYVKISRARFRFNKNVFIWLGDSSKILWDVIKNMKAPITFWLDGHNSTGMQLAKNTPILEELEQIARHPIKVHTILIDDIRYLGTWEFDYITKEQLVEKIMAINPEYKISFIDGFVKNDILVATV